MGEWKIVSRVYKAVRQTMNSLMVNPSSNENVELSFKKNNATVRPDLEQEMIVLVNEERSNMVISIESRS